MSYTKRDAPELSEGDVITLLTNSSEHLNVTVEEKTDNGDSVVYTLTMENGDTETMLYTASHIQLYTLDSYVQNIIVN